MTQILPRFHRRQEQITDARTIDRAVKESIDPIPITGQTAAGDSRKLRGIPCVARSVSGTSPGSDPFLAVQWWPER